MYLVSKLLTPRDETGHLQVLAHFRIYKNMFIFLQEESKCLEYFCTELKQDRNSCYIYPPFFSYFHYQYIIRQVLLCLPKIQIKFSKETNFQKSDLIILSSLIYLTENCLKAIMLLYCRKGSNFKKNKNILLLIKK